MEEKTYEEEDNHVRNGLSVTLDFVGELLSQNTTVTERRTQIRVFNRALGME